MNQKVKQIGSIIIIILIVSIVFTSWVIESSGQSESFFKHFPKVLIFVSIGFIIIWIISKFYQAFENKIIEKEKFIEEIDEQLENLEGYEKEDFQELKEQITEIRKMIDNFR